MLYTHTLNPYAGLAASVATSNSVFLGDAVQMTWSLTTSSGTASRWTLQGNNGDGFTATLADADWFDTNYVTAQGLYSIDSGGGLSGFPRWGRFQNVPSASSHTIRVSYLVRG
jgi:hypothetical protein